MLPDKNKELTTALESLANKLKNGYSPLVCIVGDETGIGKSMLAARMAELIYNRAFGKIWKPDGNIFFSMKDFKTELFNSSQRIFILEEAEIELGSDDWTSIANRWFSRMKSTQRIKGNLYIVVLPIFVQLARKHRRAVNYIFDVKNRGYAQAYKLKKFSANVLGDELSKIFIGGIYYELPDCKIEYDRLDILNKKRIEENESQKFDRALEKYENENNKTITNNKIGKKYIYKCHFCGERIENKNKINKVIKCSNCKNNVYIDEQNLIKIID